MGAPPGSARAPERGSRCPAPVCRTGSGNGGPRIGGSGGARGVSKNDAGPLPINSGVLRVSKLEFIILGGR